MDLRHGIATALFLAFTAGLPEAQDILRDLGRQQDFRSKRVSSFDRSGGNNDRLSIAPGETAVLAEIEGPAAIHKGLHADWISECVQRGAYILDYHNNFISAAHNDEDAQRTWDIAEDAFKAVKKKYGDQYQK